MSSSRSHLRGCRTTEAVSLNPSGIRNSITIFACLLSRDVLKEKKINVSVYLRREMKKETGPLSFFMVGSMRTGNPWIRGYQSYYKSLETKIGISTGLKYSTSLQCTTSFPLRVEAEAELLFHIIERRRWRRWRRPEAGGSRGVHANGKCFSSLGALGARISSRTLLSEAKTRGLAWCGGCTSGWVKKVAGVAPVEGKREW